MGTNPASFAWMKRIRLYTAPHVVKPIASAWYSDMVFLSLRYSSGNIDIFRRNGYASYAHHTLKYGLDDHKDSMRRLVAKDYTNA